MCGSRLSGDGKRVIVTTPGSWAEVGHELEVLADTASFGIRHSDWILRLAGRFPAPGKYEAILVRGAEEALKEALQSRQIHPSLLR
jgi:hypothetical protein